jgi:hypothetical protein
MRTTATWNSASLTTSWQFNKEFIMQPIAVLSHIALSVTLVASIILGFWGMNEYGVVPLFALLTLGGSFVLGTQLMFIITGEQ